MKCEGNCKMKLVDYIHLIGGTFIFVSALLGYFWNKNVLFFTMFIGLNFIQFSFTKFCPMQVILKKLGIKD